MKFTQWTNNNGVAIPGAYIVEPTYIRDERGFFCRSWDVEIISKYLGYDFKPCQSNNSMSIHSQTFRGFHGQREPYSETKLVRCIAGSAQDYLLDNRPSSPTFGTIGSTILSPENRAMALIPRGCLHGVYTLKPETEILYFTDSVYNSSSEYGISPCDPALNLGFSRENIHISDKDVNWPFIKKEVL